MFSRKEKKRLEHCNQVVENQLRIELCKTEAIKGIIGTEDLSILRKIDTFVRECTKDREIYGEPDSRIKLIDMILKLRNPEILKYCYIIVSDIAREDGAVNE